VCRPELTSSKAIFNLPLDDMFYTCGTTKIHNKITVKAFYSDRKNKNNMMNKNISTKEFDAIFNIYINRAPKYSIIA
jgi:spore germination protein YaaH